MGSSGKPTPDWWQMLTTTDHYIVHIARALVFNAEVMMMERLMGFFNEEKCRRILKVLRKHVDDRGLHEPGPLLNRRPRTIIFVPLDNFPVLEHWPKEIDE